MSNWTVSLSAGVGTMLAITALALIGHHNQEYWLLMAAFGASCVLIFAVPDSPLAKARNVIAGHSITAVVGVVFVTFIPVNALSLGLATGLAVMLMVLSKTVHPPAGANPLFIMLTGKSWGFLLFPVLTGAICLVLLGRVYHLVRMR
ncbi:HPP family protein [Pseudoalteromonas sp. DL2-H2.2]|uniref:HPP family protein n=1 Tax=Pseudoalteromonas sp. DL2-H2.2 TaxID=2908889 RepID=UPI001F1FA2C7|nr:HPP family protein [Pseudoalteromonas sp. DL2-H2.2]MCF2909403.1 HPP family protein [Pseudoalteromonas sp. DL2-H2.2]